MTHRASTLITLAVLASVTPPRACVAQALPDSLVERLRAGASGLVLRGDAVARPLVGTATLPLVEVMVNGTGPYRFLIDLGSNVTLLRRSVVDASRSVVLVDRATSDIVYVEALALGDARLVGVTVASSDDLDVDGVLGYNALQYSSFTLDFPGQRLVLHQGSLPPPDGRTVFSYELVGRMPYISVHVGRDSLLMNVNTGAAEVMTVPPSWQPRVRWAAAAVPGRATFNNQTGRTQVLEGRLADTLRFGELTILSPLVYVNPDAEDAWLGAAAMAGAVWTFDPRQRRVEVRVPRP
ncbi:MAG: aspartyl protease family protein [Gemmatimonadales bacterium]